MNTAGKVSAALVFLDQVSRFVFGLSAVILGMILLDGAVQTDFMFAVSVVAFAALIVRWGADHTYFFMMMKNTRWRARSLAVNAFVLSVLVAATVATVVWIYLDRYPGITELGRWTLALLAFGVAQQVSAPFEVYLRAHGQFRKTMWWRIGAQTAALIGKGVALALGDVASFAVVTVLETVAITTIYVAAFGFGRREWTRLDRGVLRSQFREGAVWGAVAAATMVISVQIAAGAEAALPAATASIFLFGYRLFGAANNIVGAAAIALSQRLVAVRARGRAMMGVALAGVLLSAAGFAALYGTTRFLGLPPGGANPVYDWIVSLVGLASVVPVATASALTGRFLIVDFGARISLYRLLFAIALLAAVSDGVLRHGILGSVLLVWMTFTTILLAGLGLFAIQRFTARP